MKKAITFPELSARTDQRPAACPRCRRAGMEWHQPMRGLRSQRHGDASRPAAGQPSLRAHQGAVGGAVGVGAVLSGRGPGAEGFGNYILDSKADSWYTCTSRKRKVGP